MKKIILAFFIMLFSGSALLAQQAHPAQPAQEKTKTVKKDATHAKTHAVKPAEQNKQGATAVKTSSTTTSTAHLKKDGTPDKRYKKSAQHVKKEGTPDKRFKENKQ